MTGEFRWNLKASFRSYVGGIEDGAETWLSDVGALHPDELVFVQDPTEAGVDAVDVTAGVLRYLGRVRFSGYRAMLMVNITDPWVHLDPGGVTVSVDVASQETAPRRVDIARGPSLAPVVDERALAWGPVPLALTSVGATILGGVYREGDALDDAWFSFTSSAAARQR